MAMSSEANARKQQMRRRRPVLAAAALAAACSASVGRQAGGFIGVGSSSTGLRRQSAQAKTRIAMQAEMDAAAGLAGFTGDTKSLWTGLGVVLISIPGVWSTINRAGQAKYVEKTYQMAGPKAGGLEMRAIAGGIVAFFKGKNYSMKDSPQEGRIRFAGNLQGSISQALYLTGVLLGTMIAIGFVLQALFPEGPFGLGINGWYVPALGAPGAGWFYWSRAFRKDICEMQLEMADDMETISLSALGDKETIESLQKNVRFQASNGQLYQLMEKGMEYQQGIFEDAEGPPSTIVYKDSEKKKEPAPVEPAPVS